MKAKRNKPIPTKEWEAMGTGRKSPYVKPFNCNESRLLALAGDIVADAVHCYRYAGQLLIDLEAERKAGIYDAEIRKWNQIRKAEEENEKALREYRKAMKDYEDALARHEIAVAVVSSRNFDIKDLPNYRNDLTEPSKPKAPKTKRISYHMDDFPYHNEKRQAEIAMANERIFFRSPTYQRLCQIDGNDVVAELDRQLLKYKGKIRRKRKADFRFYREARKGETNG